MELAAVSIFVDATNITRSEQRRKYNIQFWAGFIGLGFAISNALGQSPETNIAAVATSLGQPADTSTRDGGKFIDSSTVQWVQPTAGVSVAVDSADNVYTLDYVFALGAEMVLTKRAADGTFLWQKSFDQTDPTKWERASWVATDSGGNAIVCGTYMSGFSNPVEAASIVMKFAPNGVLLWRRVYESSFDGTSTTKCLVDASDNIYVLGKGSGTAGLVSKVKKFAPDGTPLWSYLDSAGIGIPVNFKFTPDGFITITGRAPFGSVNGYAKIDLNGNPVWSYPGVFSLTTGDCDGDAFGNTYLVHGEYVTNGGTVIKKVGPSGALIWESVYGLAGFRVEVGSDNQAVVSGFPPAGGGAALIKIDGDGNLLWSNLDADGPLVLLLHAQMLLDGANNAYLAAGTLNEMAVCKVNSDGTSDWTQTVAGGYAKAIALGNSDNSVFVVGGMTARITQSAVPVPPPTELRAKAARNRPQVSLGWKDNATTETAYIVQRCTGGTCTDFVTIGPPLPPNSVSFKDQSVQGATSYRYRVFAESAGGPSDFSNIARVTTR